MFPDAASKAVRSVLGDGGHAMEEEMEGSGRAAFPALDMVRAAAAATLLWSSPWKPR